MAIIKVNPDDVEKFTIVTTPRREYSSSSLGVTGSVSVYPRLSSIEKDTTFSSYVDSAASDDFLTLYDRAVKTASTDRASGREITGSVGGYIESVSSASKRKNRALEVERFTPTTKLTQYSVSKSNIKDMLMSYYKSEYPDSTWAYTNYNSLNFFASGSGASSFPTGSVLLYPNLPLSDVKFPTWQHSGSYGLSGSFSFDFHINPRYGWDGIDEGHYKAGTIFHLSSSYALSLVSGSARDINGNLSAFRLQLQLSHSADIEPSSAMSGPYPRDLIFLSDDNCINLNNWHHVVVRWGTDRINFGTGSFIVDGIERGTFAVPSSSIALSTGSNEPRVLCVGNYYEGTNSGTSLQDYFFSEDIASYDGVEQLTALSSLSHEGPQSFAFRHPLKAEVHNLMIRRKYFSDADIMNSSSFGPSSISPTDVALYVPPFFVEETGIRRTSTAGSSDPAKAGDRGGVIQTPFFAIDGTTDDPFNVAVAFGVGGHYINLENFTKDFATGRFPRLLSLSASLISETTDEKSANEFLYSDPGVAKRNLTIMPCDDGKFDPNFGPLLSEQYKNKFTDHNGTTRIDYINLDNLLSMDSIQRTGMTQGDPDSSTSAGFTAELVGPSPETPGLPPGSSTSNYFAEVQKSSYSALLGDSTFDRGVQKSKPLTIFQRIQDPSSDQVTIFNISNLYYGRRIQPTTFMMKDVSLSGSMGVVGVTIKDDGRGGLYRADCLTPHSTHNSIGNIFYDEGVVLVKSPHLYFFGKNQFEMSFRGVFNIYSTKYEIVAPAGMLNSSSNPSFIDSYGTMKPSGDLLDDEGFVYISGMNLHDENMNVVARANLAQPIMKRESSKILFKIAIDF